jgi:short-subunit dehydrogenase
MAAVESRPAIVITGAGSTLGRELACLAALEGNALVLVDEPGHALDATEFAHYGVPAAAVEIDLTSFDALDRLQGALGERRLYCEVLVNCAATATVGPVTKISRRRQINVINLNVRALTQLTLGLVPAMVSRGHGGVLNVGSIAPVPVCAALAAYYASKAYVNAFSAALARELADTGVTVTCVTAGLITESFAQWAREPPFSLLPQSTATDTAVSAWLGFKTGQRLVAPRLSNALVATMGKWLPPGLVQRFVEASRPPA